MLHELIIVMHACMLTFTNANYIDSRAQFIKLEESQMLGASIVLNKEEKQVNEILMNYKMMEYDQGVKNPRLFLASRHFFKVKKDIEKSEVFKILQRMPKGGALHGHATALVSQEYLYNLTYREHLYGCKINDSLKLKFLKSPKQDKSCPWELLATLRNRNASFDTWLRSQLTLNVKNPKRKYPDINKVWKKFSQLFVTVTPIITYRPIFEEYFYQALKELHEDNVSYLEFRSSISVLYELDGMEYEPIKIMGFYENVIKRFKINYPDFIGAKIIYALHRRPSDILPVAKYRQTILKLKHAHPDLLAGFDLVGQEDLGAPLSDFIDFLNTLPRNIDFFFHSGETNWYGTSTDINLVDAVLMRTKRIGHGFGLTKHPEVMKIVKRKKIAIEVCPISNQVLKLVADMRNHPASYFIASGFPVVISYDDPSFWSTKGLSYDFYMAFMGIAGRNADLRLLKQLAINSIQYSSLSVMEKNLSMILWKNKWNKFIDSIIAGDSYHKSASSRNVNFLPLYCSVAFGAVFIQNF